MAEVAISVPMGLDDDATDTKRVVSLLGGEYKSATGNGETQTHIVTVPDNQLRTLERSSEQHGAFTCRIDE